jgi:hypothetical protein
MRPNKKKWRAERQQKRKKNFIRAPGEVIGQGKGVCMHTPVDRTLQKKDSGAHRPCWAAASKKKKQKKYTARAAGGGSDRTGALTDAAERQQVKRKKYARPAEEKTGQKKVLCALHKATKKNLRVRHCCSWQTCVNRPVRSDRAETGSTGFNQDGPGKNWLKTAELKFSSEVQLASSSWTRKFSWSSQLSPPKKILALKCIRILTFSPSFWKIIT